MSSKRKREKYQVESKRRSSEEEQSPTEDEARILEHDSRGEEETHNLQATQHSEHDEEREEERKRRKTRSKSRNRKTRSRSRSRRVRSRSRSRSSSREERYSYRNRRNRRRENDTDDFMGEITSYLDNKFRSLRRELVEEHDLIAERLDKRSKPEREFKRKTNKFQYEHNTEITATMKKAKKHLIKNPPNVRKAVSALDSGIVANNFRTKCILLADRSEGGWATVEEYLQKEIASDSEDDRRMRKAEVSVARKFEQKKKAYKPQPKKYNNNNNYQNKQNYSNDYSYNRGNNWNNNGGNNRSHNYNDNNRQEFRRRDNRCFICGDYSHWKDICPRKGNYSAAAGAPDL